MFTNITYKREKCCLIPGTHTLNRSLENNYNCFKIEYKVSDSCKQTQQHTNTSVTLKTIVAF